MIFQIRNFVCYTISHQTKKQRLMKYLQNIIKIIYHTALDLSIKFDQCISYKGNMLVGQVTKIYLILERCIKYFLGTAKYYWI